MMSSLASWCTIPVKQVKTNGFKGNGEPNITAVVSVYGYVAGETVNIIDNDGHETLSSTQIYLPEDTKIASSDQFILADGNAYTIKKIKDFYDGNTGQVDIKVVYL